MSQGPVKIDHESGNPYLKIVDGVIDAFLEDFP